MGPIEDDESSDGEEVVQQLLGSGLGGVPTILLFRTGSYTLMGGKSLKYIHESEHFCERFDTDV